MSLEQQYFRLSFLRRQRHDARPICWQKSEKSELHRRECVAAAEWSNPPPETASFALLMFDQEGRLGLGVSHWVAYNIPSEVRAIAEGSAASPDRPFINGLNFLGEASYYGGCPPKGTGTHHYVFTLIATRIPPNRLQPGLNMPQLLEAIGSDALGATGLIGRFGH